MSLVVFLKLVFDEQNTHNVKHCSVNIRWIFLANIIRESEWYGKTTLVPVKSNYERTFFEISSSEQFVRRFVKENTVSIWYPAKAVLVRIIDKH